MEEFRPVSQVDPCTVRQNTSQGCPEIGAVPEIHVVDIIGGFDPGVQPDDFSGHHIEQETDAENSDIL